jgi:putative ABC transport system permease protein
MQLWESITIAWRGLAANKMRSVLTMLGIIIGVAAVIALLSIGKGFEQSINRDLESLGTNVLWISAGRFSIFGPGGEGGVEKPARKQKPIQPLTMGDVEALADPLRLTHLVAVAPEYSDGQASVMRGPEERTVSVTGITPSYESVRNTRVQLGQFITQEHLMRRARVAILGAEIARILFESYELPLGQTIKIGGIPFEVIGVLEEKGQSGFGNDQDNAVLIPLSTAQTRLSSSAGAFRGDLIVSTIYVQADSRENMDALAEQTTAVLRESHRLGEEYEEDFTIINQAQLLQFAGSISAGLTAFLGSIAGVSLLVGGIGIMNIMLVSVTERTREIGIRKAVGAKRRDILIQFLIEAMVLSLIGGFLGIGLGYGISVWIPVAVSDLQGTVVTLDSVLLATGFAAAIGLFFGVYPATRAARLNPIEALRYE